MTDKETKEIIRGVSRQDRHAQQRMLQSYGSMVFGLVGRIITSQEDAEEIYQDVFVKVFSNIDAYDESKASLATWISRIAYNECVSFTRRNKPPVIYVDDSEVDLESIQDDALQGCSSNRTNRPFSSLRKLWTICRPRNLHSSQCSTSTTRASRTSLSSPSPPQRTWRLDYAGQEENSIG